MNKKMKLFRYVLVPLILIALISGSFRVRPYIKADELQQRELSDRFLKADGRVLRNRFGTGEVVTLRGTNVGSWQVMEAWMSPTNAPDQKTAIAILTERFGKETAEELFRIYESHWIQERDFDYVKELNFNVLRLPISYLNLLDEDGKLREDTLATYDWFVEECEKRDIYVILDLHGAPGSQNGRDHSGDTSGSLLFTDKEAQDLTLALWEQLAAHYKGNPTIAGYDLLNEPEGSNEERAPWGAVQLPFYDRLYQAIRTIDPDHVILLNAVWEPSNMPDPREYGWENVMYEYHYYCWDGTNNAITQRSFIDSKVKNDTKAGFEVPVLIGEFTLFDQLTAWKYALEVFEKMGWSWTTWTYKTVGMGNWGIFNSATATTPKVNIYNDTAETIRDKWSKTATETSFTKNTYLYDLLKSFAKRGSSSESSSAGNGVSESSSSGSSGGSSTDKEAVLFQNFEFDEAELRSGTDASAVITFSKEATHTAEDSSIVALTIAEAERMPTATSRNVCITPAVRHSVDASGMNYLLFDTYVRQGNRALQVTLVDKEGNTWTRFTSGDAMPVAYSWERLFVDISDAAIDTSAIIEIRIGANSPGSYYFDNICFGTSYAALMPEETKETLSQNPGVQGNIIDWANIPVSSKKPATSRGWIAPLAVITGITITIGATISLLCFKRIKWMKLK